MHASLIFIPVDSLPLSTLDSSTARLSSGRLHAASEKLLGVSLIDYEDLSALEFQNFHYTSRKTPMRKSKGSCYFLEKQLDIAIADLQIAQRALAGCWRLENSPAYVAWDWLFGTDGSDCQEGAQNVYKARQAVDDAVKKLVDNKCPGWDF